jgi:hypothetical protein
VVREREEVGEARSGWENWAGAAHAGEKKVGRELGLGEAWAREEREREGFWPDGLLSSSPFLFLFYTQTTQTNPFEFKSI